jgi:GNAT superfamily N-acetyltransferase
MLYIFDMITIRNMVEADLAAADRVMRLAFGTFLGLPDPLQFMGDADYVHTRWGADPAAAFCALDGSVVVGSVFVGNWGSVGFFGPLTVHPEYWNKRVAQLLLKEVMGCFDRWGTRHTGLYTFPTSLKHIGLYRKFGFWPRFLTIIMEKEVVEGGAEVGGAVAEVLAEGSWTKFSELPVTERDGVMDTCRALTEKVYEGLDVGVEIRSVVNQQLGETVLLWSRGELVGLAVCHCGAGTEAGSGVCYIKFGVARPGPTVDQDFRRLLAACEQLAARVGVQKVLAGMNTARQEAWAAMLDGGWGGKMAGVAMERPDEGYNRNGIYLVDDWR